MRRNLKPRPSRMRMCEREEGMLSLFDSMMFFVIILIASGLLLQVGLGMSKKAEIMRDQQGSEYVERLRMSLMDSTVNALPGEELDARLAGYWPLDDKIEGARSQVVDASANGNDGMAHGGASSDAKVHSGAYLDGNDYITIPDSSKLDLLKYTFSAWVKWSGGGDSWHTIVSKGPYDSSSGSYENYAIFIHRDNRYLHHVFTVNGARQTFNSPENSVPRNEWFHVAGAYEGSKARTYINGVEVASKAVSGPATSNSGAFNIGLRERSSHYFKGIIDDVKVYSNALSNAEIAEEYNHVARLRAEWHFDESPERSAPQLTDYTGNGLDGYVHGPKVVDGRFIGAYTFDGANDYARISHSPKLNVDDFTFDAWINWNGKTDGDHDIIFNKESEYEWAIGDKGSAAPTGYVAYALKTAPWFWVNTGYAVPANEWTHLTLTYDLAHVKLYANGELKHTREWTGLITDTTNALWIGRRSGSGGYGEFSGMIDTVKIYSEALSQAEIQENHYNSILPGNDANLQYLLLSRMYYLKAQPASSYDFGWCEMIQTQAIALIDPIYKWAMRADCGASSITITKDAISYNKPFDTFRYEIGGPNPSGTGPAISDVHSTSWKSFLFETNDEIKINLYIWM